MTHAPLSRTSRVGVGGGACAASLLGSVGATSVNAVFSAAVSAGLAAAAMRPWGLGALALVAYVPAFSAVATTRSVATGAVVAAIASLGAASVGYEATAAIGPHVYLLALVLAPLPFAAAGAVAVRFAGVLRSRYAATAAEHVATRSRPSLAVVAALPLLWCAAEWLPAQPWLWGSNAMPLGAIGYSQVDLPTLRLATLSSVTSVSAAVLVVNALLVLVVSGGSPSLRLAASTGVTAVAVIVALANDGAASPPSTPRSPAYRPDVVGTVSEPSPGRPGPIVRLVQPNLPDSAYLAAAALPGARRALADHLAELARAADTAGPRADLTILPEAAWPGPIRLDDTARDPLLLPSGAPQPLLFGAPSAGTDAAGGPLTPQGGGSATSDARWYANSAFLLDGDAVARVQDKVHLVPIAERGLRAGTGPAVFTAAGLALSVLICYDVVFPATSRSAARAGAEVLVVLTDDSFAAKGDVPRLHLRVARFRAVETGLPLVLASNTGPSGIVSAHGSVVALTPELVATTLTAAVPLARHTTAYVRVGDWLGPLAALGAVVVAVLALSRGGGAGSFGSRPT